MFSGMGTDAETPPEVMHVDVTDEILGRGGFGVVRRGVLHGDDIAVKEMDMVALKKNGLDQYLLREVEVMEGLAHEGILRMHGWREDPPLVYLYLELLRGPELQQLLVSRGAFAESEARAITRQLVEALAYLHARQIIHRDVKAENVMLVEPLSDNKRAPLDECAIKLLDFGLARQLPVRKRPGSTRASAVLTRLLGASTSTALTASVPAFGLSSPRASVTTSVHVVPRTPRKSEVAAAEGGEAHGANAGATGASASSMGAASCEHEAQIRLSCVGTRGYAPPQITSANGPGGSTKHVAVESADAPLVDAYATGRLLRYMLTGAAPDLTMMQALEAQGCMAVLGCGDRPVLIEPQELSAGARELMEGLSAREVAERLSITRARANAWLNEGHPSTSPEENP